LKHTYTARVRVENRIGHKAGTCEQSFVPFNSRQGAISYLWPFYKQKLRDYKYRRYTLCIIVDKGTVDERRLHPPQF